LGGACREVALLDTGRIIFQGSPSELVAGAIGQVFQVTVDEIDLEAMEDNYDIVSTSVVLGRITLRGVVGDKGLPANAEVVKEPSLEESYMAFMAARGRSIAASQADEHDAAERSK
ncbi:MAG TPA: hypothetical protein QF695_12635, partial [Arenicellales bacterium]|nr:hypothetical protein [Arenicellales bacterium]